MSMSKEEAAAFLEEGLADDGAYALREHLARAIPRRLSENGFRLYIHYGLNGEIAALLTLARAAKSAARRSLRRLTMNLNEM